MKKGKTEIVPGAHGKAFKVSVGQEVIIKDLEGEQVVDFIAFVSPEYKEYLSVCHSSFNLRRLYLLEGDVLLSNFQNPVVEILEDTVGKHNMTAPCCDPVFYKNFGGDPKQRSCFQNFSEELKDYGVGNWAIPNPLNLFQNTPDLFHDSPEDTKELSLGKAASQKGDFIRLRFLTDALFAVSSCPFTMFSFNGGKSTSIEIIIS